MLFKNFFTLFSFVFTLLFVLSLTNQSSYSQWKIPVYEPDIQFTVYDDKNHGFKINIPSNWIKIYENQTTVFIPKNNVSNNTQFSINITKLPSNNITLDYIVQSTLGELYNYPDFKLLESESFVINKILSHRLVYSFIPTDSQSTSEPYQKLDVGFINKNKLFLFSFTTEQSKYHLFFPIVKKIIDSIELYLPSDNELLKNLFIPVTKISSELGNKNAKITILEFGDYQCTFCKRFHADTKNQIFDNYINKGIAKFVFKDLVILDLPWERTSSLAASASYCADEQGKYWEYHDELFKNWNGENNGWITKNNLIKFATSVGISNVTSFSNCLESGKYYNLVQENTDLGKNLGISSTPTFMITNGTTTIQITGAYPYPVFQKIFNDLLP